MLTVTATAICQMAIRSCSTFSSRRRNFRAQLIEIAGQNWADVGVASVIKEVTPDEYRSAQSANQLDLMSWSQGAPLGVAMGSNELHVPPFSTYFNARNGMLWAEWIDSDGANGVEPPAYVMGMIDDVNAMQVSAPGSDAQAAAANRLIEAITSNLLFIGTVKSSSPTYYSNAPAERRPVQDHELRLLPGLPVQPDPVVVVRVI